LQKQPFHWKADFLNISAKKKSPLLPPVFEEEQQVADSDDLQQQPDRDHVAAVHEQDVHLVRPDDKGVKQRAIWLAMVVKKPKPDDDEINVWWLLPFTGTKQWQGNPAGGCWDKAYTEDRKPMRESISIASLDIERQEIVCTV